MKKRIGTIKGKPIVEGGGSNIIKKNEISINDIGSSSGSSDNNDDNIQYFRCDLGSDINRTIEWLFPFTKMVDFRTDSVLVTIPIESWPDNHYFIEIGGNIDDKTIYFMNKWVSIKDLLSNEGLPIEILKPISKEDFYRTDYTQEEATKINQECDNYHSQFAPSEP